MPGFKQTPSASNFEALRKAQQARKEGFGNASAQAEQRDLKEKPVQNKETSALKVELDEDGRAAVIHRAMAFLQTCTEYYEITFGDLEEERERLSGMTNKQIVKVMAAYQYVSNHVRAMTDDNYVRDLALKKDPKVADFFEKNSRDENESENELQKKDSKQIKKMMR